MELYQKSPINILQEYCVQNAIRLDYNITTLKLGAPQNVFKCIVTCGDEVTGATGASKKSAKSDAAKDMITKLGILKSQDSIRKPQDMPIHVNFVGMLQEHCVRENLAFEFKDLSILGVGIKKAEFYVPSLNLRVVGKGRTKKEAKNEAAKLTLQELNILDNFPEGKTLMESMVDIGFLVKDELPLVNNAILQKKIAPSCPTAAIVEMAEQYNLLSRNRSHKNPAEVLASEYPNILKQSYSKEIRSFVITEAANLVTLMNKEVQKTMIPVFVKEIKCKLEDLLKKMNLAYEVINFPNNEKYSPGIVVVGIKVMSNPEIVEISFAETRFEALMNVIKEVALTLIVYLQD